MYPLPAILVNCPDPVAVELRGGLADNGVAVIGDYRSIDNILAAPPTIHEGEKRLFVVRVRSLDDAASLARLDTAFPGHPILALVEGDYDITGLFRVSRAGAAQILPLPLVRADLGTALDRLILQFGMQKTASRVVVVCAASEGAGATTAAIELAAEVAALDGPLCILTELPRGIGRLAGLLNIEAATTTADVLGKSEGPNLPDLQAALTQIMERLSVLVGPYNTLSTTPHTPGSVAQLVRLLRQISGFVVIDVPSTFDAEFFEVLGLADELVLVAHQDVPSVQAVRLLTGGLRERGLPDPILLVNRYEKSREAFSTEHIAEMLSLKRVFPIRPDPEAVRAAANVGEPLLKVRPNSPTTRDLHAVAVALVRGSGVPIHEDRPTVWKWVREQFGLKG